MAAGDREPDRKDRSAAGTRIRTSLVPSKRLPTILSFPFRSRHTAADDDADDDAGASAAHVAAVVDDDESDHDLQPFSASPYHPLHSRRCRYSCLPGSASVSDEHGILFHVP